MTVRELIELLQRYPDDMRVVVNGYEQGYDDLSLPQISVVGVALDIGVYDWEGQHGDSDDHQAGAGDDVTTVDVLALRRVSN